VGPEGLGTLKTEIMNKTLLLTNTEAIDDFTTTYYKKSYLSAS
jgi:hypothetical protein